MAKRNPDEQTCHNYAVKKSAAQYVALGYTVQADVVGYDRPVNLRVDGVSKRPDIIAKKGRITKVIEWETPDSMQKDHEQHRILRTWARRTKNAEFHVRECQV